MPIYDDQRRKDLKKKIWMDLLNPSHPPFSHPLVKDLKEHYSVLKGKDVFMPESPLNGLDLAYHSFAVLTGSGTMSREAAVMGRPAVSFFPGDALLSVDESMIGKGWVLHSREPEEIVGYLKGLSGRGDGVSGSFDRGRSLRVREELATLIRSIIDG